MEIILTPEHAYSFNAQFTTDIARDRLEQKKASLMAGTVGALLARPKQEEIQLLSQENRWEPFWLITASAKVTYDRSHTFSVPVSGVEVRKVTALGQELTLTPNPKGVPSITFAGVEQCVEERQVTYTFDGASGEKADLGKYLSYPRSEIEDLNTFAPEGSLVVPPQVHASAVLRPVLAEVIKPVQAQVIHEEYVKVEALELNFHPIYAFEYAWEAKAKRGIFEFDALTGDIHSGGKKLSDQIRNVLTRDVLFDVTADAASLFIPGGSIAVKLVKAVVDNKK